MSTKIQASSVFETEVIEVWHAVSARLVNAMINTILILDPFPLGRAYARGPKKDATACALAQRGQALLRIRQIIWASLIIFE